MTDSDLLSAINADPTALSLATAGDDSGCATRLSATLPPTVASKFKDGSGLVGAFSNPADGFAAIQALQSASASNPLLAYILPWLAPGSVGLDMGNPAIRAMLDQLQAASVLTADAVTTLKAIAEVPVAVSAGDVSRVMAPSRPNGKVVTP